MDYNMLSKLNQYRLYDNIRLEKNIEFNSMEIEAVNCFLENLKNKGYQVYIDRYKEIEPETRFSCAEPAYHIYISAKLRASL
jgi:hypothetical protein